MKDIGKQYLSGKVRKLKPRGIKAEYNVIVGDPAQSIMRFAQKDHIDLLIMTTHGKGGIKRAVMGSITGEVVRESGKPVLVVNPQARRK